LERVESQLTRSAAPEHFARLDQRRPADRRLWRPSL